MKSIKNRNSSTLFIILVVVLVFVPASVSSIDTVNNESTDSKILYVGGQNPGNYSSIQDAIDDAIAGDTVFVFSFSSPYYENIEISKPLKLIGEDKDKTIIDAQKTNCAIRIDSANGIEVQGFTIQNSGFESSGIYVCSNYNRISENIIRDNDWAGIEISNSFHNIITDNTIFENEYGIYTEGASYTHIQGNSIGDNRFSDMSLLWPTYNVISDNIFKYKGIFMYGNTPVHLTSHIIQNNIVNNKPLRYYKNGENIIVPENTGQVIIANCNGCIIQDLFLSKTFSGLLIGFSEKIQISNNIFNKNIYGIYLADCTNVLIKQNSFNANQESGIQLKQSYFCTISNNVLNNNYYAGIKLGSSNNNQVIKNSITNSEEGITLHHIENIGPSPKNNLISENIVENNIVGIQLGDSLENNIDKNMIIDNDNGIIIYLSFDNTIQRNTLSGNDFGLMIQQSSSNIISENVINKNRYCGIRIRDNSNNNVIVENEINANKRGIDVRNSWSSCTQNMIYHNNFQKNILHNAQDFYTNKYYHEGIGHGNYWDDYTGLDLNGDGIGDKPYRIYGQGNNEDMFPLMNPWVPDRK